MAQTVEEYLVQLEKGLQSLKEEVDMYDDWAPVLYKEQLSKSELNNMLQESRHETMKDLLNSCSELINIVKQERKRDNEVIERISEMYA